MHGGWERDLERYFAGELAGAMGLRSWLGPMLEREGRPSGFSASSPPEPGMEALNAARTANVVEGALARCSSRTAGVLHAFYTPRGPWAPFRTLGDLGPVVLHLAEEAVLHVERLDYARVVALLSAGHRPLLEVLRPSFQESLRIAPPGWHTWTARERLLQLETLSGRSVRRTLQALDRLAQKAVTAAHTDYACALDEYRLAQRADRVDRLRATLEGR